MSSLLKKSIQLRRFHVAILIVIVSLCAWGITRYSDMIQARLDQFVFYTSVSGIRNAFVGERLLNRKTDPKCQFLDNPDLFKTRGMRSVLQRDSNHNDLNTNVWHYDAVRHQLIFTMKPNPYFRSNLGPQILVTFVCEASSVAIKISPHQWCQEMRLTGCLLY